MASSKKIKNALISVFYKDNLEPIVRENVLLGSQISTDEHKSYSRLSDGYNHQTVNHTKKEYVRGDVHTNTLEGHWSHFKRAVLGTHIHISAKHMWKYVQLSVYAWRCIESDFRTICA